MGTFFTTKRNKLLIRILYHLLFWVAIYSLFGISSFLHSHDLKGVILFNLAMLPIDMAAAYLTIYVFIPRFLFTRRYWTFGVVYLLFATLYILLIITPYTYFMLKIFGEGTRWSSLSAFLNFSFLYNSIIFFMINGLAATIKIAKHWITLQTQQQKLEKEQLDMQVRLKEAELSLLKLQLHPHFLFNTLNNLYGLTLQKSDAASEIVMKLSEMLHYMLYDCSKSRVPLVREIRFLRNYLDLETIRHDPGTDISFEVEGKVDCIEIAPLILLTFIENAIKHGLSHELETPWIHIVLTVSENTLNLSVKNSCPPQNGHGSNPEDLPRGIGLINVKKRLELQYPKRYALQLEQGESQFLADLTLDFKPK